MQLRPFLFRIFAVTVISGAGILLAQTQSPNGGVVSPTVFMPSAESQNKRLSAFDWDATSKTTNVPADAGSAHLIFYFTNKATHVFVLPVTNITTHKIPVAPDSVTTPRSRTISSSKTITETNVTWATNAAPFPVIISQVHPSCGCTTAQLPPLPWTVAPGTNGEIGVTVNLAGKFGTVVKTVHVATSEGSKDLIVQITILPPVLTKLTDADRTRQMAIAKVDRQAVFKNDCATCHMKQGEFKYGKELYDADCGICHEAEHRASMVPDLHNLKVPTNPEFWRTWIAHGKPGTFMPAFSVGDGGPLDDMQIAQLAQYLTGAIPSKVPQKFQ
jgi:mono/diheme cytochrome c family protein